MSSFEYLVALLSVVAALGLARALSGIAKHIHSRDQIAFSWIHVLWTINVLIWLVAYWWFSFALATVDTWTPQLLLFVLVYGALIYFLIALLYPDQVETGADLFAYFAKNRRWFFGALILLGVMDLVDAVVKSNVTELAGPPMPAYALFMTVWIGPAIAALFIEHKVYHGFYALTFFCALVGYVQHISLAITL
ncbi:MAG: hypothetical protein AAF541_12600 [Pseudomonadota bacterium]